MALADSSDSAVHGTGAPQGARPDRSLGLAVVVFGVTTVAFLALVWIVTQHDGPLPADIRILRSFVTHRTPFLTTCAKIATTFGTGVLIYGVLIALGLHSLIRERDWRPLVFALVFLQLGILIRFVINQQLARPRPSEDLWLVHPAGYSFPSGHTATATVGYGIAAWLVMRNWPRLRPYALPVAVFIAFAVGLSRIYLGVHWPSDVLAGWLFGTGWLALGAILLCLVSRRDSGQLAIRGRGVRTG